MMRQRQPQPDSQHIVIYRRLTPRAVPIALANCSSRPLRWSRVDRPPLPETPSPTQARPVYRGLLRCGPLGQTPVPRLAHRRSDSDPGTHGPPALSRWWPRQHRDSLTWRESTRCALYGKARAICHPGGSLAERQAACTPVRSGRKLPQPAGATTYGVQSSHLQPVSASCHQQRVERLLLAPGPISWRHHEDEHRHRLRAVSASSLSVARCTSQRTCSLGRRAAASFRNTCANA